MIGLDLETTGAARVLEPDPRPIAVEDRHSVVMPMLARKAKPARGNGVIRPTASRSDWLAERVGFEPTRLSPNGFQVRLRRGQMGTDDPHFTLSHAQT